MYLFIEGCGWFFWPFWDCSILSIPKMRSSLWVHKGTPILSHIQHDWIHLWGLAEADSSTVSLVFCGTEMHDLHNFGLEHLLPNPDDPVSLGFVFNRTGVKLETSQFIGFRNVAYWISIFPGLGGIETWSRLLEARHQLHGAASSIYQGESYQKMPRAQAGG